MKCMFSIKIGDKELSPILCDAKINPILTNFIRKDDEFHPINDILNCYMGENGLLSSVFTMYGNGELDFGNLKIELKGMYPKSINYVDVSLKDNENNIEILWGYKELVENATSIQ